MPLHSTLCSQERVTHYSNQDSVRLQLSIVTLLKCKAEKNSTNIRYSFVKKYLYSLRNIRHSFKIHNQTVTHLILKNF